MLPSKFEVTNYDIWQICFSVCVIVHLCIYSEDEDPEYKPLRMPFKDDLDDFTNSPLDDKDDMEGEAEGD